MKSADRCFTASLPLFDPLSLFVPLSPFPSASHFHSDTKRGGASEGESLGSGAHGAGQGSAGGGEARARDGETAEDGVGQIQPAAGSGAAAAVSRPL